MDIETKIRERTHPRFEFPRYGRPYMSPSYREYNAHPRVYVGVKDETVLENFAKRFDRPIPTYREAAKLALEKLGITGKLRWSQKAGCSCGCSPGFVLRDQRGGPSRHFDVWVMITGVEPEPITARGADRAQQLGAQVSPASAGRGPHGKLRNFSAMSEEKLSMVIGQMLDENNDPEALAAALRAKVK